MSERATLVGELGDHCAILERKLAEAIRERDNALSDLQQADTDSIRALHERNAERELADRLAHAVEYAVTWDYAKAALDAYKAARQEKP